MSLIDVYKTKSSELRFLNLSDYTIFACMLYVFGIAIRRFRGASSKSYIDCNFYEAIVATFNIYYYMYRRGKVASYYSSSPSNLITYMVKMKR